MDDGILCGPAGEVARALAHLEAEFGPAGLQINHLKYRVFCHDTVVLPDSLQQLPRASLSSGSLFLGVPVGSSDTLSKLEDLLKKTSRLESGLGKFLILLADKAAVPFRRTLEDLLHNIASDEQFTLACMASRRGGLGLKNPTWTHGPTFLASCFTYAAAYLMLLCRIASSDSISPAFWEDLSSVRNALRSAFNLPVNFLADVMPLTSFEPRDVDKHWKQSRRQWRSHGCRTHPSGCEN